MAEQIPIGLRVSLDPVEAERNLVRFLKDYADDARRKGFVIGLSGGIDSALAAALAVRAVGNSRVHGLILPDDATPKKDLADAARVATWLGIKTTTRSIQGMIDAIQKTNGRLDRPALGNAKARCRMILLHAEAANRTALVLGTGNKSEIFCGYFSKYGDGGVDIQPIGDLYKTQVRLLAKHVGVPKPVLVRAPTAGLWAGQTDEKELGITYATLDRILLGFELKLPPAKIGKIVGVPTKEVLRIDALRRATQHKRRMPMSPKMGLRTVGIDWRATTLEP
jgi:NAD+ synthase